MPQHSCWCRTERERFRTKLRFYKFLPYDYWFWVRFALTLPKVDSDIGNLETYRFSGKNDLEL